MTLSSVRLWFCAAVAVVAAAIADPIVEYASNAGVFGARGVTDHSNLDVVPALFAGVGLLALFMVRKAPAVLAGRALPRRIVALLPAIFLLQILALYAMETAEQLAVCGHLLGPWVWLGGPPSVSLAAHAVVCFGVTIAVARWRRTLAATALRIVGMIAAIATLPVHAPPPLAPRTFAVVSFKASLLCPCTIGERAPPR